jgi:5-methylcytosine-specific restriction endonuclease McrA
MGSAYSTAEYKRNRKIILETNNYICHYCGLPATTADHIQPVSKGGTNELSNLLPACHKCNSTRQNRTLIRMPYWNIKYR